MDETFQMLELESQHVVALADEEVKPRNKGGKHRETFHLLLLSLQTT